MSVGRRDVAKPDVRGRRGRGTIILTAGHDVRATVSGRCAVNGVGAYARERTERGRRFRTKHGSGSPRPTDTAIGLRAANARTAANGCGTYVIYGDAGRSFQTLLAALERPRDGQCARYCSGSPNRSGHFTD